MCIRDSLKTADGTGTDTNADTGKKKVPYPGTDRQIPSTGKGRTRTPVSYTHLKGRGGEYIPSFVSIDKLTNEVIAMRAENVFIPKAVSYTHL